CCASSSTSASTHSHTHNHTYTSTHTLWRSPRKQCVSSGLVTHCSVSLNLSDNLETIFLSFFTLPFTSTLTQWAGTHRHKDTHTHTHTHTLTHTHTHTLTHTHT